MPFPGEFAYTSSWDQSTVAAEIAGMGIHIYTYEDEMRSAKGALM
jgi:hypothetical protein